MSCAYALRPLLASLVFCFAAAQAGAEPAKPATLRAGDALPSVAWKDQHGTAAAIDASTALLLFTRDMDAGAFVKETLAEGGREKLAAARAVYLADVSGMPGFVRSTFALPAMRKRGYPVLVDESGEATAAFPHEEGKVTAIELEAGRIRAIRLLSSSAEVSASLSPAAAKDDSGSSPPQ